MKAKCIRLFTLNLYVFYFLLLCIHKGLTITTNHGKGTHHTLLRHERHYKAPGFQSYQQQQPHFRHTPASGINEAVHAFHPSNNLHLLHSLQYNSRYAKPLPTTTTRKPFTTRQVRHKNYNHSPSEPSATSYNYQNSLKLYNHSHKQPFRHHTTLMAMSPSTTVAPENVYRHPLTHNEHVRRVNKAENPFLTTSKYGPTTIPQSKALSKSSASIQSITESIMRIHPTPQPHRSVYRGSEEQDDYFNEKNYGSDTFSEKNYREIIADGNRWKEMNLKNVIDDDDDNGEVEEVEEDEDEDDGEEDDEEYEYLDDESTLEESGGVGSLTNEKWENYGTREAVDKSRSQIAQRSLHEMEVHSATAHLSRVYKEALCKFPKPKIIPIVAASKRYTPHCTVLHRCGDDTGCCQTDASTCVPKRTATVDLYFYVTTMEKREPSVEYLTFINHTECHCLSRHNPANVHRNTNQNFSPTTTSSTSSTVTENNCRCVRHFTVFHEQVESIDEDDGIAKSRCRCDCEPNNISCDSLKRGMDGFSIENRRCIEDKRCSRPTCQYGQYNTSIGRCPKVEDKLADARKLSFNETSRLRFD